MAKRCPELTLDQVRIIQGFGYYVLVEYYNDVIRTWQRWKDDANTKGERYAVRKYITKNINVDYQGSILEKNLPYRIEFKSFDELMSKIVDIKMRAKS